NGPKAVELDDEAIWIEERRPLGLARIVEISWRGGELADEAFGQVEVPGEFAVAQLQIDQQRNQESVCHGVDEGRTLLHRHVREAHGRIEGLRRHGFEPFRQALHRGGRPRQNVLQTGRAAKCQRCLSGIIHEPISSQVPAAVARRFAILSRARASEQRPWCGIDGVAARVTIKHRSKMSSRSAPAPKSRPLDALAIIVTIGLCLSSGFNNVSIKLAIHDVPPLIQSAARSVLAALIVFAWTQMRGMALFRRDGTLAAGVWAGVLFALEFLLIYRGLVWTTATRGVLFLYLAPFFVVIGSRWLVPSDHFSLSQWLGLVLSFAGIVIAFGLPTPATDPHQALGDIMFVGAGAAWAATTLLIKASALNRVSVEKTLLYQLVVSAPLLGAGALIFGERMDAMP